MGGLAGILAVLIGLIVSVGLHELGHMIPAKRFGALVPEYAIGFGPELFSVKRGETRYVLRAILLGGYVRILAMFAPGAPGRKTRTRSGRPTLAEEARRASAAELPEGAEGRAFHRLSWWRKAIVMAAGPFVNLILALLILAVSAFGIGVAEPSLELAAAPASITTPQGEAPGPAAAAGVVPGDRILAVNGAEVTRWEELGEALEQAGPGEIELRIDRAGTPLDLKLSAVAGEDGRPLIGVVAGADYRAATAGEFAGAYARMLSGTAGALLALPKAVWDLGYSLATGAQRDANGLVSIVGVGRIAGEATAAAGSDADSLRRTWTVLLSILASLNVALGLFNLIPLPPLDGGHIAGALVEGARSRIARLRGRPDPGPIDTARLVPLTYAVGALLLAMSVLLIVADIIRPIGLH